MDSHASHKPGHAARYVKSPPLVAEPETPRGYPALHPRQLGREPFVATLSNEVAGRPVRRADRETLPARYSGPGAAMLAPATAAMLGVAGVAAGAVGLASLAGQRLGYGGSGQTGHPAVALIGLLLIALPAVLSVKRGAADRGVIGAALTLLTTGAGAAILEGVALSWPTNSPPTAYANFLYANLAVLACAIIVAAACTVRRVLPGRQAALPAATRQVLGWEGE